MVVSSKLKYIGEWMEHHKVIILGSGPAGLTAAIYAGRANLKPLILGGYAPGGQLMVTTEVENFPGHKSILGPELVQILRQQAEQFGTQIIDRDATKVDLSKRPFVIESENEQFTCDALIIATGASSKKIDVPGEKELAGKGVSYCATCDGFFFKEKRVIVVGGGDSAMEEALFLTKFARELTIVHRKSEFKASKIMQDRVLKHPKIKVIWDSQIEKINGESQVQSVTLKNIKDSIIQEVPIDGVFVAIGHTPNTKIFEGQLAMNHLGYLTIKDETHTEIEGVFIAGDVFDARYRQAVTAAGSGCKAAIDVEKYLEQMHQ